MAKAPDYDVGNEIIDIVERTVDRFPAIFDGFDPGKVRAVITKGKRGRMKIHPNRFPFNIFTTGFVYIFEACGKTWEEMSDKQKRLEIFHVMCAIPRGGFDQTSKDYGRKLKPEIEMFLMEFAASGGVPNWTQNPSAKDPLELEEEELEKAVLVEILPEQIPVRQPLTADQVVSV